MNDSEMTIAKWIFESRTAAGLTQGRLSEELGVTRANISGWENGRHEPSFSQIMRIAELTGNRVPIPGQANAIQNVRPSAIGTRRIPLISSVQAGRLTEAVAPFPPGGAFEYLLTDLDLSEHAFALEIEGLSMAPEFSPGDRVIVDPAIQPRPGDFVVAKNGREEATFKKYRARGVDESGRDVFELVPLNPDYPTIDSRRQPVIIIAVMAEHRRYRKK